MKLPVRRQHSGGQGNTTSGVEARKADVKFTQSMGPDVPQHSCWRKRWGSGGVRLREDSRSPEVTQRKKDGVGLPCSGAQLPHALGLKDRQRCLCEHRAKGTYSSASRLMGVWITPTPVIHFFKILELVVNKV